MLFAFQSGNLSLKPPPPSELTNDPTDVGRSDDAVIGRAFRRSFIIIIGLAVVVGAIVIFLNRDPEVVADIDPTITLPEVRDVQSAPVPPTPFTDITQAAGLTFLHENGATGEKLLPETMGGGCAFLDFDHDGDQDILLVNSQRWPWDARGENPEATTRLYANDGDGNFQDVTETAGLATRMFGMGVAVGDYDNDGFVDVYLTGVHQNRLFQNQAGTFVDVTESMGVAGDEDRWSTSSGWIDFDNDGDLDLFVCNYVQWTREIDAAQDFQLTGIGRAYGPPTSFAGAQPYLFRNDGDHFTDISASSGVEQMNSTTGVPLAKSLGIAPIDLNRDGWIDLVVANDTVRNLIFMNRQDGTFDEIAIDAGVAFDAQGKARGAMGIDAAQFRNDDCIGIAIANFANEMTGLYVCDNQSLLFTDDAIPTGLGPPTRSDLSFGLCFLDVDLDGRLDLLAASGHLETEINSVQSSQHYQQPTRLFWNAGESGSSEFVAMTSQQLGDQFGTPIVGRGASFADIDQDGDLDVLLTQIGGSPLLLRNDQDLNHNFLRFKLIGRHCNHDAIGARVTVNLDSNRKLIRAVMPTRSYLSQVELPITFGLGKSGQVKSVEIEWPDGQHQTVKGIQVNQLHVIEQPNEPPLIEPR